MIPEISIPCCLVLLLAWICPWYPSGISIEIPVHTVLVSYLLTVVSVAGHRSAPADPGVLYTGVLLCLVFFMNSTAMVPSCSRLIWRFLLFLCGLFFFGDRQSFAICPFLWQL